MMLSDSHHHTSPAIPFQSPNAIPPRTSSTGCAIPHVPSRSVLRPVSESDWLGQSTRSRQRNSSAAAHIPALSAIMQSAPSPERFETEDVDYIAKKTWTAQKENILMAPYHHVSAESGKNFRKHLIAAFNSWLEVPDESLEVITTVVGMLHNASLMIDDVEDSSELRRGMPVSHTIFGTPQTINSANYIYFLAMQELQKLGSPKAMGIFTEELLHLHRGQGMDLFWRDNHKCPSEDEYLEMVGNKTGGLFRLGIKLMQAESESTVDCTELVNLLGLIYQIRDDYLNLDSDVYSKNKGMCEDLTEGKFSFLIIHSIRTDPDDMRLLNILRQKTKDEEVKRYAVKLMEKTGSFTYTKRVVDILIKRARDTADRIHEDSNRARGIHQILDFLMIPEKSNGN